MLFPVLLALMSLLSCGLTQRQSPGAFNIRHYCTGQHSGSKYKASCDGSNHFKDKNIILNSQSVLGITDIELYSFESINITSQSPSDWDKIKKITIRNCKKVILSFQSTLRLNELEIDSVDVLSLETKRSEYSINSKLILLSNIGNLNLTNSNNAGINTSVLTFNNIKDVNFSGKLQLSGELLTISQSNIDLTEHSTLLLNFASITVKESTKLYIQKSAQLNILTDNFLIQESYIYMDGQVNITGYSLLESKKVIKFLNNSIYGMKKSDVHIYGDRNEIGFIENGIYSSDISDIIDFVVETTGVTFTKNHFGCNKCAKRQLLQAKYPENIGEQNFCYLTCNLTLTSYKALLDNGQICNQGEFQVDEETLCSGIREPINKQKCGSKYFWWTVIPVAVVSLVCLSILLYFYCKRYSPRFRSMPMKISMVLPPELENSQANQKDTVRAFSNEVYARVNNSDNIYEIVDSP